MKILISGFLKERIIPRLESTESRVEALRAPLNSAFLSQPSSLASMGFRLDRVAEWQRSARTLLPIARKILGGG
jgi:hypothetical protein